MPWSRVNDSNLGSSKHNACSLGIARTSSLVSVDEHVLSMSTLLDGVNWKDNHCVIY